MNSETEQEAPEQIDEDLKGFTLNNDGTVVLYFSDRRYSGLLDEEE